MDSTLEEEIARLSRPQTAEDVNLEHGTNSVGTTVPQGHLPAPQSVDTLPAGRIIAHPAPSGPPCGNVAVAPWRSGSASNNVTRRPEMSRQGSGKSSGSARTSPPGRAAGLILQRSNELRGTCDSMLSCDSRLSCDSGLLRCAEGNSGVSGSFRCDINHDVCMLLLLTRKVTSVRPLSGSRIISEGHASVGHLLTPRLSRCSCRPENVSNRPRRLERLVFLSKKARPSGRSCF